MSNSTVEATSVFVTNDKGSHTILSGSVIKDKCVCQFFFTGTKEHSSVAIGCRSICDDKMEEMIRARIDSIIDGYTK